MAARLFGLSAALLLLVGTLSGDDKKKGEPDQEAMMKHAMPGEPHKVFEQFAGKWDYTLKYWMDPSAPPMEMKGSADSKTLMDGRFFSDHVKSADGSPMPFEGRGWQGYDNHTKKYWFSWIDSMSTSLTTGEGTWDPKANTMTWRSEGFNPMVGTNVKMKEIAKVNADGTIHKTFFKLDGGKEVKEMELSLTKAK
jgi:Protein of unknown function (DUF1579)